MDDINVVIKGMMHLTSRECSIDEGGSSKRPDDNDVSNKIITVSNRSHIYLPSPRINFNTGSGKWHFNL